VYLKHRYKLATHLPLLARVRFLRVLSLASEAPIVQVFQDESTMSFAAGVALAQVLRERAARQVDKKLQKPAKEGPKARSPSTIDDLARMMPTRLHRDVFSW
jgi:hypothetical protein